MAENQGLFTRLQSLTDIPLGGTECYQAVRTHCCRTLPLTMCLTLTLKLRAALDRLGD